MSSWIMDTQRNNVRASTVPFGWNHDFTYLLNFVSLKLMVVTQGSSTFQLFL